MAKKLYVGNLPFSVTEQILADSFAQVGAVAGVKIITDRETGRSRGFGFVEMTNDNEADEAISKFNGAEYEGRALVVSEARPTEPRTGGGPRGPRPPMGGGDRGGFRGGRGDRSGGGGDRGGFRGGRY
jgi:RNA recognition motif-containing protein